MSAHGNELPADLVVVGGGLGGIAATLAACRLGRTVVLVEELDWLGGQLTSQGVPPDEHPWIEVLCGSQSYAELRQAIRAFYRAHLPLTDAARAQVRLNPGQGNVGTLCHEPWVAVRVIDALLAPHEAAGLLTVLRRHRVLRAETQGDRVQALTVVDLAQDRQRVLRAPMFIDATEIGDLLEQAGVEHVFGAEAQSRTGEPHALRAADPFDQQAITWCLAADYLPGEDHRIDQPAGYERLRTLQLECWPGPQFSWTLSDFVTHEPRERPLFVGPTDAESLYDLWHARRIAYRHHFEPGRYASDITLANWPQMDYWEQPIVGVSHQEQATALQQSRELSLAFFYWMQTEAPRHDGGQGYPGLRLRGDVLGTTDGLAKQAYYREGRRIEAEFTVLEQHIGVSARPGKDGAEPFADSVGIGAYRIDLHPSTRGRNTVDIDSFPFQIPLGALLPVRVDNLLPACKNLGTTRITNGAYREHATEWSIGEAAGALAAFALARGVPARAVRARPELLADYQRLLQQQGVLLAWPRFGALTPTQRVGYRHAAR
ncbi:FAD-dependent oxidoreductase [Pseudorhodoferax sp. Leaf267]|uniref:FAD-dependent oxidoreductase n=1 Tax=Pseudorhodoferax sp. Leaf267 TaxID=1736316 RepID=UPI0006FB61FB|nr:FAD-dependent oxidoreductase [Pseudorhodoferax sp. Leaf267]KQP19774.1 FAD-dependent oxidoreductase [Pseudorhodoferax sp. Leaf267]